MRIFVDNVLTTGAPLSSESFLGTFLQHPTYWNSHESYHQQANRYQGRCRRH